jgi:hypothetical protein
MLNEWVWLDLILDWFQRFVVKTFDRRYQAKGQEIEEVDDSQVIV